MDDEGCQRTQTLTHHQHVGSLALNTFAMMTTPHILPQSTPPHKSLQQASALHTHKHTTHFTPYYKVKYLSRTLERRQLRTDEPSCEKYEVVPTTHSLTHSLSPLSRLTHLLTSLLSRSLSSPLLNACKQKWTLRDSINLINVKIKLLL